MLDLILGGGTIVDGSAAPARRADIGIEGDRITAIGDLSSAPGERLVPYGGGLPEDGGGRLG